MFGCWHGHQRLPTRPFAKRENLAKHFIKVFLGHKVPRLSNTQNTNFTIGSRSWNCSSIVKFLVSSREINCLTFRYHMESRLCLAFANISFCLTPVITDRVGQMFQDASQDGDYAVVII